MTTALLLPALALLLWAATALRAFAAIGRTPRLLAPQAPTPTPPRVAVFVPVRDEMDALPRTLPLLQAQRGVELELWLYDDRSTDGSGPWLDAQAQADGRLTVVHAKGEPPPGWYGKPHALTRLVEAYGGRADLWLFLDADVELQPDAVAALVHALTQSGADVASFIPELVVDTFWAATLGPNFAALATLPYPPERVNRRDDPTAFFNGQVVLVRRAAYEGVGGFAAVRGEVLEDVALAKRLKAAGHGLWLGDGQAMGRTQMYRTLAEHVQGWRKNIFHLVGHRRRRALGLATFLVTMAWLPLASLACGAWSWAQGAPLAAALGLVGYLVPTALQVTLRARGRAAPAYAPFAPLAAPIVAGTLLYATFAARGVRWKGRAYA